MSLTLTLERGGGEVSGSGTNIELDGTIAGGAIESVEMYGDTEQATIPGDQLLTKQGMATPSTDTSFWGAFTSTAITSTPQSDGWTRIEQTSVAFGNFNTTTEAIKGFAASTVYTMIVELKNVSGSGTLCFLQTNQTTDSFGTFTVVQGASDSTSLDARVDLANPDTISVIKATTKSALGTRGLRFFTRNNVPVGTKFDIRVTILAGDHSSDWQNYVGENWKPYVGGTASPNPDYPQEVQTVTGRQVVTISDGGSESQSYTIDLGDIELCKIGTYQDYIYKSGDDWYLHKETGKTYLSSTQSSIWAKRANGQFYTQRADLYDALGMTDKHLYCNTFTPEYANNASWDYGKCGINQFYAIWVSINDSSITTSSGLISWFGNNNTIIYYPVFTPTDTQITNSALIAQLEAINAAQTYDGTTVITVESENLAGPLEVKAATNIKKTYTEVEIGSPFTISDVEGKSSNTTLDGNVYVDWAYNKKQYSFDLFNLTPQDYADIRAFYDYQFSSSAFPTITVPELNINKLPVYMEISSRNIINQCLLTDKLTIKFRETFQP